MKPANESRMDSTKKEIMYRLFCLKEKGIDLSALSERKIIELVGVSRGKYRRAKISLDSLLNRHQAEVMTNAPLQYDEIIKRKDLIIDALVDALSKVK